MHDDCRDGRPSYTVNGETVDTMHTLLDKDCHYTLHDLKVAKRYSMNMFLVHEHQFAQFSLKI